MRRVRSSHTNSVFAERLVNFGRTFTGYATTIFGGSTAVTYNINETHRKNDDAKSVVDEETGKIYKEVYRYAFKRWDNRSVFELTDEFYVKKLMNNDMELLGYVFEPVNFVFEE